MQKQRGRRVLNRWRNSVVLGRQPLSYENPGDHHGDSPKSCAAISADLRDQSSQKPNMKLPCSNTVESRDWTYQRRLVITYLPRLMDINFAQAILASRERKRVAIGNRFGKWECRVKSDRLESISNSKEQVHARDGAPCIQPG